MAVAAASFSERPGLWDQIADLSAEVWPEYNRHGDVLNRYWGQLYERFPEYQLLLYDDVTGEALAEGHTIPMRWNGDRDELGEGGIDWAIDAGFRLLDSGGAATTLCALAAEIPPRHRERGLARVVLEQMTATARGHGLSSLVAPVRPNWKDRYPLAPIDRYAHWVRVDGSPFDPWIRVHVRMGAEIGPPVPRSMRITGSVGDWETWTGMAFPESGTYVFPDGLATVDIDRERDVGCYWEPNVWLIHTLNG
jgi:GNAT superfamily N-acetyltransferase